MHIAYTDEQRALQDEVRALLQELITDEVRAELEVQEGGGPLYHQVMAELAAGGWLGVGWPAEYGGQARTPIEEFIFFDEVHRSGFPIPLLTLNTVGPTLIKFGTDEQKADLLPRILAGEVHFAIGYSEPGAGTDLASLKTTAVQEGDEYVISGQKIWISLADFADYLWLACKTDPDARHKGISVVMVPMNAEGVSTTPIANLGDSNIHAVYLDNVRVPVANRIGPENGGWRMITSQLNHERVALMMVGPLARLIAEVTEWARQTPDGDGVLLDRPWVRRSLAKVDADLEVLRLMNWRQAWTMTHGHLTMQEASAIKVYGSEMYVRTYRSLLEILGVPGLVHGGSPGAVLRGELERHYRATLVLTFGGGVNEVQRDLIAVAGLRLPRGGR